MIHLSREGRLPPGREAPPGAAPTVRVRATGPDGREALRSLPEETPVAFVYNGGTQAVMMATPADIADFAWGFTLTEGIAGPDALPEVEVVSHDGGIEARMWLPPEAASRLLARRRASVGPVGCGLCGIDSLAEAVRPLPHLPPGGVALRPEDVRLALEELRGWQPLHDETRAVHAAGFWQPGRGILVAREDVGRHNALDKLIGALLRMGVDPASGAVALTSRMSVEMVQKCVMAGARVALAVSAPTAHAVRIADASGLTLASASRGEVLVFAHGSRIGHPPRRDRSHHAA